MKALLVDLYDTIAWTEWSDVAERLATRLGVDTAVLLRAFDSTRVDRGTGRFGSVVGNLAAVATACGSNADPVLLSELAAESVAFLRQNVRLYDDVLPVLRRLRAAGTRLAVISNCDHATRPVVDDLGLAREVDTIVLSFEVGRLKPEQEIFVEALRRMGVAPHDSVFVDDQARYLEGAASLGIRTVRMARGVGDAERSEPGSPPVISSLRHFLRDVDEGIGRR